MTKKAGAGPTIEETLAAIREQLAVLTERVTALESAAALPAVAVTAEPNGVNGGAPAAPAAPAEAVEISEETLLLISAAIAAFLGKKPRIRQIRLANSVNWAQQGRAGIHSSHAFVVYSRPGPTS